MLHSLIQFCHGIAGTASIIETRRNVLSPDSAIDLWVRFSFEAVHHLWIMLSFFSTGNIAA